MNTNKKKNPLSDETACEIVSQAISDVISLSQNENFKGQCYDLLQVTSDPDMIKQKLNNQFTNFINKSNKRSKDNLFESMEENAEECSSIDSLIRDIDNIQINPIEELDGFDTWENNNSKNL